MIYMITGVVNKDTEFVNVRSFGFFYNYEDAVEAVEQNYCDMHEGFYEYMVIEPVKSGIHPYTLNEHQRWFKFNDETDEFERIEGMFTEHENNWHGIG